MDFIQTISVIFSLILVFLFALQKFSHQIQLVAGEKFRGILEKFINHPIKGAVAGALITSVIQSSSATSVILISLVDAGISTFERVLPVLIGANIGSTITAQLIALKMTYVAPIIVIAGFIIAHSHSKFRKYGKSVFYFGMIFLSLLLISYFIEPITNHPLFISLLKSDGYFATIAVGAIVTAIIQSSSIVTGIVILLAGEHAITLSQGVGIIMGSNIGSPVTALLASISAKFEAKKVAVAQFLFNVIGVLIFLPFLKLFELLLKGISSDITQQLVNAHFIFNFLTAILCLVFIKKFGDITNFVSKKIAG